MTTKQFDLYPEQDDSDCVMQGRTPEQVDANYRIAAWSFILLATTLFWGFVAWVIRWMVT